MTRATRHSNRSRCSPEFSDDFEKYGISTVTLRPCIRDAGTGQHVVVTVNGVDARLVRAVPNKSVIQLSWINVVIVNSARAVNNAAMKAIVGLGHNSERPINRPAIGRDHCIISDLKVIDDPAEQPPTVRSGGVHVRRIIKDFNIIVDSTTKLRPVCMRAGCLTIILDKIVRDLDVARGTGKIRLDDVIADVLDPIVFDIKRARRIKGYSLDRRPGARLGESIAINGVVFDDGSG